MKPDIINSFDFLGTCLAEILIDEDEFISLSLLRRFEKNLLTLKNKFC